MSDCAAELCANWTGSGCACEVFDIEKPWNGSAARPWPGYCQNCGAPLDPPNATDCWTCGASDVDG